MSSGGLGREVGELREPNLEDMNLKFPVPFCGNPGASAGSFGGPKSAIVGKLLQEVVTSRRLPRELVGRRHNTPSG